MKIVLLSLISLLPFTAFAADQEYLNSIYKNVGQEILDTINLEDASKNEVSLWLTDADQSEAIQRCNRESGLNFKKNNACIQAYQQMSLQLNRVINSTSWKYMRDLLRLAAIANSALRKLDDSEASQINQECNSKLHEALESVASSGFLNSERLSDEKTSMEMNTDQAVSFLKMVTKKGRRVDQYLNLEQPKKETLIERGREIHLAVRVVRMSLLNQPTSEQLRWTAEDLMAGCLDN